MLPAASSGLGASGGGADHDDLLGRLCHCARAWRQNGVGSKLRLDRVAGLQGAEPGAAAAFTAWQIVIRESSRNCLVPRRGLVIISTAPYSRARKVLCAPSSARLEQITTGIGCWLMIFFRKVSPSMRGISMSSVITSGICSAMRSAATKGSPAVAMTSISGSARKHVASESGAPRPNHPQSDTRLCCTQWLSIFACAEARFHRSSASSPQCRLLELSRRSSTSPVSVLN